MSEQKVKEILDAIDNYTQTISAITSFSHALRWDDKLNNFRPNSYYFIGRKMNTSKKNRINKETQIIPDLIVGLNDNYGITGEVKISLPQDRNHWEKYFIQLEEYDDDLRGWKTKSETIETQDLVLISHYGFKAHINDYLNKKIGNKIKFNKKFAVIVFSSVEQRENYYFLEKSYGSLSIPDLDNRFHEIVKIPIEKILKYYSSIKFYDVKPVIPYTMSILWTHIFNQYPRTEEFMESEGKRVMIITVNLEELIKKLRDQYGPPSENDDPRQRKFPKTKWVKEAMDMFVQLNHAEKVENKEAAYRIKYKYTKIKNPLQTFIKEILELEKVSKKGYKTLNNF